MYICAHTHTPAARRLERIRQLKGRRCVEEESLERRTSVSREEQSRASQTRPSAYEDTYVCVCVCVYIYIYIRGAWREGLLWLERETAAAL
jgi:hypothetical protein